MINIAYITADSSFAGGGAQVILNLSRYLDKEKFAIHLICPSGTLANKARSFASVHIVEISSALSLKALQEIRHILYNLENDCTLIVHAHGIRTLIISTMSTVGLNVYKIYTEHLWTSDYKLSNPLRTVAQKITFFVFLGYFDKVICVSKAVMNFLRAISFVNKEKFLVCYNGIPENLAIDPSTQTDDQIIRIVSTGRLQWEKQPEHVIEIVSIVQKKVSQKIILTLIGDGPLKDKLQNMAKSSNICLEIYSNLHQKRVFQILSDSNIYIQTSVSESFGIGMLEAMQQGIPIVAYKVGGIPELVKHEQNGYLIKPYELNEFADKVTYLVAHKMARDQMSKKSVEISKNFNVHKMVQVHSDLYEKL